MTKNLNWEISIKDLVTFKDGMGLVMKSFNIIGVHSKIRFLGEGGAWKNNCFFWGAWWFFFSKWKKRRGDVFEVRGGRVRSQCTLESYELKEPSYWHISKANNIVTQYYSIITNNVNYNWHIVSTYLKKKVELLTSKVPISR